MAGTKVLKVKLYNLCGITAFSTEPAQIGGDYAGNARFLKAIDGETASKLEFRERFNAIDGPVEERWVLSSYIPVRSGEGPRAIEGVAEIYTDVSEIHRYVRRTEFALIGIVTAAFSLVFLLLLAMIWRADRQIRRHHRDSLELAASAARAESASRAKSEFLANMSHELRTPLNAIIGFSEIIKDGMLGPIGEPRYQGYAGDIYTSGQHLLAIINDVLDLARVETGKMRVTLEEFDAVRIAREVAMIVGGQAEAAEVALTVETTLPARIMESDENKVRQILLNLVANAIKFTETGGGVVIGIGEAANTGTIRLTVSDTGIGMKPADIPAALAPFGQIDGSLARRHDGAGLGLTLSLRLARLLGGELSIESTPGAGTVVTVTLPTRVESRPAEAMSSAA